METLSGLERLLQRKNPAQVTDFIAAELKRLSQLDLAGMPASRLVEATSTLYAFQQCLLRLENTPLGAKSGVQKWEALHLQRTFSFCDW